MHFKKSMEQQAEGLNKSLGILIIHTGNLFEIV